MSPSDSAQTSSPRELIPLSLPAKEFREYGSDEPLPEFLAFTGVFAVAFLALWAVEEPRKPLSAAEEAALLVLGTHKLTRILTRDRVLAPFRAPFTRFEKSAGAGEVEEETRGSGFQKAMGYLVTCPYCVAPWVAVGLKALFRFSPSGGRLLTEILAMVTASDFLNQLYAKFEES